MKHTELYMLPKKISADSDIVDFLKIFFYLPTTRLQRAALSFFLSLSLPFFLNVSLNSFSSPLAGCTEDALNPVQVVVGGTHTQTLAPHVVFDLPLLHVLQRTEGPALCKIEGRGGGRAPSAQLALADACVDHPWTVLALFFLFSSFFGCFESTTLLSFLCPLTEVEQD